MNFTPELEIESYTDADKEEVGRLIVGIQKDEFNIPISLEMQPDLGAITDFYQVGKGNFWVAKVQNKMVGTIALLDIGNDQAALRKMFVVKDYRGKPWKTGEKLLHHLLTWSVEKGIQDIFLGTTEKFVGAQRFYEKNGFTELAINDLPARFPIMDVDVKFYKYSIIS